MMKYFKWLYPILAMLFFSMTSCTEHNEANEGYKINIELDGLPDDVFISLINYETKEVQQERFQGVSSIDLVFADSVSGLSYLIYSISKYEDGRSTLLVSRPLFISNENVTIKGDVNDFTVTTHSETQKVLEQWNQESKAVRDQISKYKAKLYRVYNCAVCDSLEHENDKAMFDELTLQKQDMIVDFIAQHKESPTAGFLLYTNYHSLSLENVQKLYDTLDKVMQKPQYLEEINIFLTTPVLECGDGWNDFKALDINGDSLSLSEIERASDKYILLNFTSRGCIPCERSISELKEVYAKHKDKLEIVSYYQGFAVEDLKSKVMNDQMDWMCVCTTMSSDYKTMRSYNVDSFPKFILISPERKIIYSFRKGYRKGFLTDKMGNFFRDK